MCEPDHGMWNDTGVVDLPNRRMVWTAVAPGWVVPAPVEVVDLHWLAYRVHSDTGSARCAGISGGLAWVCGGCAGPVTGRTEKPVTEALARAEMWAAIAMSDGGRPDLAGICADLGVEYWPPLAVEQGWAEGVWLALRWLLGEQGADAPMTLPQRSPDGALLSAEELYERTLAGGGSQYDSREQRQALHAQIQQAARKSHAVADLIDDTKRRLSAA
jgi:hypothetical protein